MRAADIARGRWPGLLERFGIDCSLLTGKHGPCPACRGRDRFRFDDQDGRGTFFCSHCGAGDGFKLLQLVNGWSFKQAASEIEETAGSIAAVAPKMLQTEGERVAMCRAIWRETRAIVFGDPVHQYLHRRTGITDVPTCIRFHPNLKYRHADNRVTYHPAMIAKVTGRDGNGVALHRTYLSNDGRKADVPTARKALGSLRGSCEIRLFPAGRSLGIAEGIETALAASMLFDIPVWSSISANIMEKWTPPAGTEHVIICGDNDWSGTGQAAAWNLARRLIASRAKVEVKIPNTTGDDWNDHMNGNIHDR